MSTGRRRNDYLHRSVGNTNVRTFNNQNIHLITAAHTSQSRLLIYEASDNRETVEELFKNFETRFHWLLPADARPWNPRRRICPFVSSKLYLIVHMLRLLHPIRLITSSSVILSEHENTYRHVRDRAVVNIMIIQKNDHRVPWSMFLSDAAWSFAVSLWPLCSRWRIHLQNPRFHVTTTSFICSLSSLTSSTFLFFKSAIIHMSISHEESLLNFSMS